MLEFLTELRRRKVTRAVIAFAVGAFALIEIADIAVPRLGLPDATVTWLVWLAILGLPVVIMTSWFFDVTTDGGAPSFHRDRVKGDEGSSDPAPEAALSKDAVRRARMSGAIATGAILLFGWGAWTTLAGPPGASASTIVEGAERIAILPFRPAATDPELTQLGRNLVVTMSTTVEAVGEVRTSDPTQVLNRVAEDGGLLTPDEAIELGRLLGASAVVTGSLVRDRNGAGLQFRLLATDDGREIARGSAVANELDLYRLTDAATVSLLRGIWRDGDPPTENLDAVTTESTEALTAFLEGEKAFRAYNFRDAMGHYRRAIDADTTFALPHWRVVWISGWSPQLNLSADSLILARHGRLRETLPRRERLHSSANEQESRRARLAGYDALIREYPDYAMAVFQLGDLYFHYASLLGLSTTAVDSLWAESRRLGATDQYAERHYQARELYNRDFEGLIAASNPAGRTAAALEYFQEVVDEGRGALNIPDRLLEGGTSSAMRTQAQILFGLGHVGPGSLLAELAVAREPSSEPHSLTQMVMRLARAAEGRWQEALETAPGSSQAPGVELFTYRLAAVGASAGIGDTEFARSLRPATISLTAPGMARFMGRNEQQATRGRDFADGLLALLSGDELAFTEAIERLRDDGAQYLPTSLELHRQILAGQSDAVDRLIELEYAAADVADWEAPEQVVTLLDVVVINRRRALIELLGAERFTDAERLSRVILLENELGQPEVVFTQSVAVPLLLPLRAQALEGLGRVAEARAAYEDYLSRMSEADAVFDEDVAAARTAVARLGG